MRKLFGMNVDPNLLPDVSRAPTNAAFPVERLIVAPPGRLSCTAHKNPDNPLHLDWDFCIRFEPVEFIGETCDTAITIEIESREIRSLEQFAGFELHEADPDGTFGSFYLFDGRSSVDTRFKVHSVKGNTLDVEMSVRVDVGDSYVDPEPPMRLIKARADVVFEGILVSSYGTQSKSEERELMRVANEMFDTSKFRAPRQLPDDYNKNMLNLFFDPLP